MGDFEFMQLLYVFFSLGFLQQKRGNAGLCSATGSMQWGCERLGSGEHTSAVFPSCSYILNEKNPTSKFTLLRLCFVINFTFYEPRCLWWIVKQNEEGN